MLNVGERFRPHVPLNSSHRSELAPPPDVDSVGVSRSLDGRGFLSVFFYESRRSPSSCGCRLCLNLSGSNDAFSVGGTLVCLLQSQGGHHHHHEDSATNSSEEHHLHDEHEENLDAVWKGLTALSGVYFMFLIEHFLTLGKMYKDKKQKVNT